MPPAKIPTVGDKTWEEVRVAFDMIFGSLADSAERVVEVVNDLQSRVKLLEEDRGERTGETKANKGWRDVVVALALILTTWMLTHFFGK